MSPAACPTARGCCLAVGRRSLQRPPPFTRACSAPARRHPPCSGITKSLLPRLRHASYIPRGRHSTAPLSQGWLKRTRLSLPWAARIPSRPENTSKARSGCACAPPKAYCSLGFAAGLSAATWILGCRYSHPISRCRLGTRLAPAPRARVRHAPPGRLRCGVTAGGRLIIDRTGEPLLTRVGAAGTQRPAGTSELWQSVFRSLRRGLHG